MKERVNVFNLLQRLTNVHNKGIDQTVSVHRLVVPLLLTCYKTGFLTIRQKM